MEIHCLRSYVYRSQSTVAWFMHMVGSDDGLQQSIQLARANQIVYLFQLQIRLLRSISISAGSPARMCHSAEIHPATFMPCMRATLSEHTKLGKVGQDKRKSRFTELRTASVTAYQPAETLMTCLTQSSPFHLSCGATELVLPFWYGWLIPSQ